MKKTSNSVKCWKILPGANDCDTGPPITKTFRNDFCDRKGYGIMRNLEKHS
jgi:hypothetical protein